MTPPPGQEIRDMATNIASIHTTVGEHERRLNGFDQDIKTLYKVLSYRLPLWATFLISGLTFFNGWLVAIRF